MRVLGLDVGDKRIGIALSDPSGMMAFPVDTLIRKSMSSDVESVLRIVQDRDVGQIVIGIPLSLTGGFGPQAKITAKFAGFLSDRTDVPIVKIDERFSTSEAERLLVQAGVETGRQKARIDAAAAAIILQCFLDSNRCSSRIDRDTETRRQRNVN